jgi:hypothetical protein
VDIIAIVRHLLFLHSLYHPMRLSMLLLTHLLPLSRLPENAGHCSSWRR